MPGQAQFAGLSLAGVMLVTVLLRDAQPVGLRMGRGAFLRGG